MMDVSAAVLQYANRGLRLQLLLRGALVVFLLLTIVLIPPEHGVAAYYTIVVAYAIAAVAFARWAWPGGAAVARWGWLGLFGDLVVLAIVTLIAGTDAHQSWTSNVLVMGFFLVPVLAATQLRPWVCASVVAPTVLVYLVASLATKAANDEPWDSIALRTFMLASVGAAAVGLSRIQRMRVEAISGLLADRNRLLDDLLNLEERQRRELSERLHDGALQYVLAARLDLDDVREESPGEAVDRIDHALVESSRMLRSTVSELHPAVLERAGLARALQDLAQATTRPDLAVAVDVDHWPSGLRTPVDGLLFGAAKELLSNVVKHAGADCATVSLGLHGGSARLVVTDDGRGLVDEERRAGLGEGHVGLYSQAVRVEAAGGSMTVVGAPSGTTGTVMVPVKGADLRRRQSDR
jgi:two-component system NarL family sensor kinase